MEKNGFKIKLVTLVAFVKAFFGYPSGCCRYYPTCSDYISEAFFKKGFIKAVLLSAWRLIRCNPFSRGGFDPVSKQ